MASSGPKKGKRCVDSIVAEIPSHYVGFSLRVERHIARWARCEVAELDPLVEAHQRSWKGRAEVVDTNGFKSRSGQWVVPKNPADLIQTGELFKPSTASRRVLLSELASNVLSKDCGSDQLVLPENPELAVTAISSSTYLLQRLRASISDMASARKRAMRDSFFTSMGYNRLVARYSTDNEHEAAQKSIEAQTARHKCCKTLHERTDMDFGWWRTGPVQAIHCCPGGSALFGHDPRGVEGDDKLTLFRDRLAVDTYHAFSGYNPVTPVGGPVECTILSLARADAWLCTATELLGDTSGKGGARQKSYQDKYHKALQSATSQLLGTIRQYIQYWHP